MAEVAKSAVAGTEEVINAAVARSKAVMMRQWAVYDHEKVFWNSAWTMGIIGLGWVAVKLGMAIKVIAQLGGEIGTGGNLLSEDIQFNMLYDYVEGSKKDPDEYPLATLETDFWGSIWAAVGSGLWPGGAGALNAPTEMLIKSLARKCRDDPAKWNDVKNTYKANYKLKYGKDWVAPSQMPEHLPLTILESVDKFFNTYGPIMPFAAVLGHMGLESVRVYRTRKKLGAEM